MAGSQIATSVTIINSLLGFQAISLTNMNTSAATAIAAGSKVEIASAFFTFASDETPNATAWTAITTGETAYITLTPSGTAGSQVVSASWTSDAPVWDDAKQGWYTTTTSSIRVVGGARKDGATQYESKFVLPNKQKNSPVPGRTVQYMLEGGAYSEDSVFERLQAYLPNVGDVLPLSGSFFSADVGTYWFAAAMYASRTSTTRITVYAGGVEFNGSTYSMINLGAMPCSSGTATQASMDGGTRVMAISWL